jgi:hypothetical protein
VKGVIHSSKTRMTNLQPLQVFPSSLSKKEGAGSGLQLQFNKICSIYKKKFFYQNFNEILCLH